MSKKLKPMSHEEVMALYAPYAGLEITEKEHLDQLRTEDRPVSFWKTMALVERRCGHRIPEFILRRARLWFDPKWRKLGIPD